MSRRKTMAPGSLLSGTSLAIEIGLRAGLLARKARARDPTLRQSRRAVDRWRRAGADMDLDGLRRTQREARFRDPKSPGGTHRRASQQAPDNIERLLESRPRLEVGAHRREPVLAPAQP